MRLWGVIFGRPHFLRGRKGGTPPKKFNFFGYFVTKYIDRKSQHKTFEYI